MTTSVFLVRHGAHCDLGHRLTGRCDGVRLSDAGERQAAAVARWLAGEGLTAIYTSPRLRARVTAEAIAGLSRVPVRIAAALDEIDFGDWTGRSFAELQREPLWRLWNEARHRGCPPNGERMSDAVARIVAQLERVSVEHDGDPIAAVTHCDMIRGAVAHYLGLPLERMLRFDIDCGSITTLRLGTKGAQLASLNEKSTP